MLLSVSIWGLLIFGMRSSPDAESALRWERPLVVFAYFTYLIYYHFTLMHTDTKGRWYILLAAGYTFLLALLALAPTSLLIEGMRHESYGYAPVIGPLAVPLGMAGPLLMGAGAYNLFKRYRISPSDEERNRLLYLLIAIVFPLSGGFIDGFSDLPPIGIWSNLIFCTLCSIAIVKYHLLDIRILIRKSLVYLLVSSGVAVPYVLTVYLLQNIIKLQNTSLWLHGLLVLTLAILLQPLYGRVQSIVDKLFYRERYDYFKALERFSREFQSVDNVNNLNSALVELVSGALRAASACLLLPLEGYGGLAAVSWIGLDAIPPGVALRDRSLLVKWLKDKGEIISFEESASFPNCRALLLWKSKT